VQRASASGITLLEEASRTERLGHGLHTLGAPQCSHHLLALAEISARKRPTSQYAISFRRLAATSASAPFELGLQSRCDCKPMSWADALSDWIDQSRS